MMDEVLAFVVFALHKSYICSAETTKMQVFQHGLAE